MTILNYMYLEDKWIHSNLKKLQKIVNTVNSREVNVTQLGPTKVSKKNVTRFILLLVEHSHKLRGRHNLYVGYFVRQAKIDIIFWKGCKQSFTDQIFENFNIPTGIPSVYKVLDAKKDQKE